MFSFWGGFGVPVVAAGAFIHSCTPLPLAQGLEQQISVTLSKHIQGSRRTLFIRTKHNRRIFRVIPFIDQATKKDTEQLNGEK